MVSTVHYIGYDKWKYIGYHIRIPVIFYLIIRTGRVINVPSKELLDIQRCMLYTLFEEEDVEILLKKFMPVIHSFPHNKLMRQW